MLTERDAARFWAKVDRSAGHDACWPWTGLIAKQGYGRFGVGGRQIRAHRIAYELSRGIDLPAFEHADKSTPVVRHLCDRPACCNPAHLLLGTQSDNIRDMVERGRQRGPKGEANGSSKLTAEKVRAIRRTYACGGMSCFRIAQTYGVGETAVRHIIHRKKWAHVPD